MTGTERTSMITIRVGSWEFTASLADNETARAFSDRLPLTLEMQELNGNEKYDDLADPLPAHAGKPGTIRPRDLMLYGSRTIVLFYETFSTSYRYTRIGKDTERLLDAFAEASAALVGERVLA